MSHGLKLSYGRICRQRDMNFLLTTGLPMRRFSDIVNDPEFKPAEMGYNYIKSDEGLCIFNPRAIAKGKRLPPEFAETLQKDFWDLV